MPALETLPAIRIVAAPAALDDTQWPAESLVLRLASDEALVIPPADITLDDPHAIIAPEGSFMGLWLPIAAALSFLERACVWELPTARPAFAQGAVANVPMKLWFEHERVLFIVQAPFAADFEARLK
ncbi:MAG: hypothetical protein ACT4QE_13655 [Anaerolineales bacterium]